MYSFYNLDYFFQTKYNQSMPSDVITINALVKELSDTLSGKKILKVRGPNKSELDFEVRTDQGIKQLVISADPSMPAIYLSDDKKESPVEALSFCMLARKHLSGGIITDISLLNCDRVVQITVNSKNELNDNVNYLVIVELTGRRCNLIIANSDMTIIDAIRRSSLDADRLIYPKAKYNLPPEDKIMLDSPNLSETVKDIQNEKELLEKTSGLAKSTAKEISLRFPNNAYEGINYFLNIYGSPYYSPCVLMENGKPKDFFTTGYLSIEGEFKEFSTISSAIDYVMRNKPEKASEKSRNITSHLNKLIKRTNQRIAEREKTLEATPDEYKVAGELILNNLWRIKKGDKTAVCENYYTGKEQEITLDPLLTPNQNASAYFKKYTKLKRAIEYATNQLQELYNHKEYLESIRASVENAATNAELSEITEELDGFDGKAKKQKQKQKLLPSKPLRISYKGYEIYCGKNNKQNQQVTFAIASSSDLWLHVKNYHGSHTIIKGGNPPEDVIMEAAGYAAYLSGAKGLSKVEVDVTQRKYVKKLSLPGMVTYTNHYTVIAAPKNPVSES